MKVQHQIVFLAWARQNSQQLHLRLRKEATLLISSLVHLVNLLQNVIRPLVKAPFHWGGHDESLFGRDLTRSGRWSAIDVLCEALFVNVFFKFSLLHSKRKKNIERPSGALQRPSWSLPEPPGGFFEEKKKCVFHHSFMKTQHKIFVCQGRGENDRKIIRDFVRKQLSSFRASGISWIWFKTSCDP